MSTKASDSKPSFTPQDQVPLPPPDADVITTCCDYCIVACGYKVYRWPADGPNGGPKRKENALGLNFPLRPGQGGWVGPNQFTQLTGKANCTISPWCPITRPGWSMSWRTQRSRRLYRAESLQPEQTDQRPPAKTDGADQRQADPGKLDFAMDIAAEVGLHAIRKHGESSWAMKYYCYQYFENTYALTKLALNVDQFRGSVAP